MATSTERALAVTTAFADRSTYVSQRGTQRLTFDQLPVFVPNKRGEIIGVSVMVRLFDGLREIPIDPRRIIVNCPLVPRANLTYEELQRVGGGTLDTPESFVGTGRIVAHGERQATEGIAYRRIVGTPDPEAALIEAVWDSVLGVPNARGFRTRGTVSTIFATAPGGDGTVQSIGATYAAARTGGSLGTFSPHQAGQTKAGALFYCWEAFIIFDTSGIPDTDDVSAVTASFDGSTDTSTTDFIAGLAASAYDGGAVVTTDWVSGAAIPTPELATWNSSGYVAGYNAFTETADFKDAISKTDNTSLILYSQRHRDATAPPDDENVAFIDADAAGTTTDPKLDITHAAGAAGLTPRMALMGVG